MKGQDLTNARERSCAHGGLRVRMRVVGVRSRRRRWRGAARLIKGRGEHYRGWRALGRRDITVRGWMRRGAGRGDVPGYGTILDGFVPKRVLYVTPTGSDSNGGDSVSNAWATLAHAPALQPGDEIRVATGSYPCPLLATLAGTAVAPIHFVPASDGPRTAKLDCSAGGMFRPNLQYVAFDGFESPVPPQAAIAST